MCQRNKERAFEFVWYRHVATAVGNTSHHIDVWRVSVRQQVRIRQQVLDSVLDSVLDAFRVDPFAVSPERTHHVNDLRTLNRKHKTTTRHERLARQIGKAWVDVRVRENDFRVQELAVLQTSLFEPLWSGTVEQLKQHSPHSSDNPERPEFERAVEDLDRMLQGAIVRSTKQHLSIAILRNGQGWQVDDLERAPGRLILPSYGDGGYNGSRALHPVLIITAVLLSTALPCRLRHVEGQRVPKLHFHASSR